MSSLTTYAAAVCAAAGAWFVRGALAVRSATSGAAKIGLLPPWWELALFVLAGICAVYLFKPSRDRVTPLFITFLCVLPWMPGVSTPALLVWTGPLAAGVWIAAALATIRGREPFYVFRKKAPDPLLAATAAFIFFAAIGFGAREMVPGGDEPHYLIIAQSLLYDGDVKIENNHARGDYAPYFQGTLRPDYWVRGTNGAIYSIHAPGLSAIVAPAYLIAGYRGVVFLLLVISAAGVALAWKLAWDLTGQRSAAWFASAALAAATPIAFHSFTIYPDGPAAVLTLTGAWALLRMSRATCDVRRATCLPVRTVWLLHGLGLALLPWLHTRFAILAGLLGVFILLRMPRTREGLSRAAAFLVFPVLLGMAWFAYFWVIYGTPNPDAPYGDFFKTQSSWSFVTGGLAGVLFDQQFGMMTYAPVFLIAFAGWVILLRREPRLALELAVIVVPYMIATTHLRMWWGGWSAPARFSVAVLWLAPLPMAVAWSHARSRAGRGTAVATLVISALTTTALAYVDGGRPAYNVRDGYALWLEWPSGVADLPLGFPSFFRWHTSERLLHLQILAALALFVAAFVLLRRLDRRVRGTGAFTLLMMAIYAAAGTAMLLVLWRVNDSPGVRPSASQLKLLSAAQGDRRIAVEYRGRQVRRLPVDAGLQALAIESPPRMRGGDNPPALVLPGWFPAGRYRISAEAKPGSAYELLVLRSGTPIATGTAGDDGPRLAFDVLLPVDVPAIILRGAGLERGSLTPLHVATRRERLARARASTARRYGRTLVWFLDGDAFNEPEGLWIRGGAESDIVIQPEAGSRSTLLLRNGPVPNEVGLQAGDGAWKQSASLRPDEEREVEVPIDPQRGAALVRIVSRGGFRPSEVDPKSTDRRYLGVWVSPH
ncbi:MAG: hypothetical protein HYU53_10935 [Acidobacteria bacterium]|nr:hypothetical protein [Acidobacteriota bacterium]